MEGMILRKMPRRDFVSLLMAGGAVAVLPTSLAQAKGKADKRRDEAELFRYPGVIPLRIEIPAAGLAALRASPRDYVKATVREGESVLPDVGVRLKGQESFQPLEGKPALALKFNEYTSGQKFHGAARVLLNNAVQDPTWLSEALGSEVFTAAKVPAARAAFAQLNLNGRDLGLYVLAEAVNRDFLSLHFHSAKGNLYEGVNNDITDRLELDSGDDETRADLKSLGKAVSAADPAERWKRAGEVLHLDRFMAFAAAEVFTGHREGYTMGRKSYRIYADPDTRLLSFLPHGLDQLFRETGGPLFPEWKGLVAQALLTTPDGRKLYVLKMRQLVAVTREATFWKTRLNELAARIRPFTTLDATKGKAWDEAVKTLLQRVEARTLHLEKEVGKAAV